MKRKIIAFAVILLFVSVGFIPVINGNSEVELIESRNVKFYSRIKEFSTKLLKIITLFDKYNTNDCGCDIQNPVWSFPVICSVLALLALFSLWTCIVFNVGCELSPFIYNFGNSICNWW